MTATSRDNNQRPPWPRKKWAVCWFTPNGARTGRSRSFFTVLGAARFVIACTRSSSPKPAGEPRIEWLGR
jgi:hypothetical protein